MLTYLIILFVRAIGLFGNLVFHEKPLAPTKPTIWKLLWFDIHGRCDRNATSAPCLICHECFMAFPFFHLTVFSMLSAWLLDDCDIKPLNTCTFSFSGVSFQSSAQHLWNGRVHHLAKLPTTGLELLGCQDQLWWPCDRWQGQTVSSMHLDHLAILKRRTENVMGGKYDLYMLVLCYFLHSYTIY